MKLVICLLVLSTVLIAQSDSSGTGSITIQSGIADDSFTVVPSDPSFCIGRNCTSVLEDSSLEVEKLTDPEQKELVGARKALVDAQGKLNEIEKKLEKAHGDTTHPMNYFSLNCPAERQETRVEIHGIYAFKTKRETLPCGGMILNSN